MIRQLLAKPRRCRLSPRFTRTIKPLVFNVARAVAACDFGGVLLEFLPVLVPTPSRSVALTGLDPFQLGVELFFVDLWGFARAALAGAKLDKLALDLLDFGERDDLRAARRAFTRLVCQHGLAFGTEFRERFGLLLPLIRALALRAVVEVGLVNVRNAAKPKVVSGMVEDDELVFAFSRAEAATCLLHEEDARLGRLGINDAPDVGVSLSHVLMMSSVISTVSMTSASPFSSYSPATVRTPDKSGSDGA